MRRTIFIIFALLSALFLVYAVLIEPRRLAERELVIANWPGPSLKVVFFSDLHVGSPHIDTAFVRNFVADVNSKAADLILIGGDFVSNRMLGWQPQSIETVASLLGDLRAPLGVYAVLGNHEWYQDGGKIRRELERAKIGVLENEARKLTTSDGFSFWLVGIGDAKTNHADVTSAIKQVDTGDPKLILTHDPAAMMEVREPYALALAGHTHGGQISIPWLGPIVTFSKAPRAWARGLTDLPLGPLYVSNGIGTSLLPLRFNARPEFLNIKLAK